MQSDANNRVQVQTDKTAMLPEFVHHEYFSTSLKVASDVTICLSVLKNIDNLRANILLGNAMDQTSICRTLTAVARDGFQLVYAIFVVEKVKWRLRFLRLLRYFYVCIVTSVL
jgi:hypothetical protein